MSRLDVQHPRLMRALRSPLSSAGLFLALTGCAGAGASAPVTLRARPNADAALEQAAEAFFAAETPAALRAAVERARAADPDAAITHELAASLALYEADDRPRAFAHVAKALQDLAHDAPHLATVTLVDLADTFEEREVARALLTSLSDEHPDPALRARASAALAPMLWAEGRFEAAKAAEARVRTPLEWRVVGAWDNDQGKGFDEVFPPEREIDLSARYDGALLEIGWRAPVLDPVGPPLDLGATMSPARWAIAYATSAFEVAEADRFELRVTTGAPFKVWVDGQLVFSARVVHRETFDQWVIPVRLDAGRHRILVKSAQDEGPWNLGVRVTRRGGRAAPDLVGLPPDAAITGGGALEGPSNAEDAFLALAETVKRTVRGPLRANVLLLRWAELLGLRSEALAVSDALLQAAPRSIVARYTRAGVTWNHGERGKASDLLEGLAAEHGDELGFFHLQRSRFLRQEGLQRKAREALEQAERVLGVGSRWALSRRWARQFEKEGWVEDRCKALEQVLEARPGWHDVMLELGQCYQQLRFSDRAEALYRELAARAPGHAAAIERLFIEARDDERYEEALELGQALVRLSPHRAWPLMQLAELHRRRRHFDEAARLVRLARGLDPDNAGPWGALARIRYQAGDRDGAVGAWRESLARNPDDEAIANRLAFLAPEEEGIWAKDVPDEARIEAALALRGTLEPAPGAHTLNLLDHEVTLLKPDGSTTDVVTLVIQALDETGRDHLTKIDLRRGGRLRMRQAYVVAPDGTRTQVSNVRNRVARFRNLSVGSTVVLQYRHDAKPVGYLSRHMARGWWFQAAATQAVRSEWVLWLPSGTTLHEWLNDPTSLVERTEEAVGRHQRVAWVAGNVPPLIGEPNMPTQREVAVNLLVSTVPDWDTFLEWEKALLTDAFREDASIEALARRIVGDAASPREKALRIHRWLMEEIRYQQDYEDDIAGVRPHAAPVVVERSYGDCKDKSVLFITLARLVGLEAQFALLRTRPKGPLLRSVPMQQFDHAIVYVPAQPGLETGFFIDSTADALDLSALRHDDTGVDALVLDPKTETHTWRPIPFRPAEENGQELFTLVRLEPDGSAEGELQFLARGMSGSNLRRLARNTRALEQGMQGFAARLYGGAVARAVEATEVKDLERPAHLRIALDVTHFARSEGRELRARLPPVWNPKAVFQLESRRYPLVLGVPQALTWRTRIELGSGLRVRRLPSDIVVEAPCFRFERSTSAKSSAVEVVQRYQSRCERIEVEAYAEHRARADTLIRALEDELVLTGATRPIRAAR